MERSEQVPEVRRASFPSGYGARGGEGDDPVAWEAVERRLREAPNYWLATIGADRRPHVRPIDGVWVSGSLCFGGSPATRWVRNLDGNPAVSVHLPSGDDVVIVEGMASLVTDPEHQLAAPSAAASRAKYPQYHPVDEPTPFRPFWVLTPQVVYAWTLAGFPSGATRWSFE